MRNHRTNSYLDGDTALFLFPFNYCEPGDLTEKFLSSKGLYLSSSASLRLQLFPAVEACQKLGLKIKVLSLRSEKPAQLDLLGTPKVCFIGKVASDKPFLSRIVMANLAAIARLKRRKVPIIVVYSDNWCEASEWPNPNGNDEWSDSRKEWLLSSQSFYRDLLYLADLVVAPCLKAYELAKPWFSKNGLGCVIEDPLQVKKQPFLENDLSNECKLIWFGHFSNIRFLLDLLPSIVRQCTISNRYELTILSGTDAFLEVQTLMNSLNFSKTWSLRFRDWFNNEDWDPSFLEQQLSRSHISIVPSDINNLRKIGVSHNRVSDSLQCGCIVVASPMPSYTELSRVVLVGDNLPKLINYATSNYAKLTQQFDLYRNEELSRFQPLTNRLKWEKCIINILNLEKNIKERSN